MVDTRSRRTHGQPPVSRQTDISQVIFQATDSASNTRTTWTELASTQSTIVGRWAFVRQRCGCNSMEPKSAKLRSRPDIRRIRLLYNVAPALVSSLTRHDGGSTCLETFLASIKNFASYFDWTEEDELLHLRASLRGPAGQLHLRWHGSTICCISTLEHQTRLNVSGWRCVPVTPSAQAGRRVTATP